jgi:hypothetical protein
VVAKRVLAILAVVLMAWAAWAAPAVRYLHVKVDNVNKQQSIHISLPLSVAAKLIPAFDHGNMENGKIQLGSFDVNGVDVGQVLNAMKSAPEGEYVTIQQPGRTVRVARERGLLMVHVENDRGEGHSVDVSVPWAVAEALISGNPHQLNVDAAVAALGHTRKTAEVTVKSDSKTVSIWVDSESAMQ